MSAPWHIVVMLGGPSAEREVSLRSGQAVADALRGRGHQVTELDPGMETNDWSLPPGVDVVFLALHGTYGEDGTVQKRLDDLGIAYTGCGPAASRLAFDKVLTKQKCEQAGLTTPRYQVLRSPAIPWPAGWQPPLVLKPVRQGSSVGLQFVNKPEQWSDALSVSFRYDHEVLLEEKIDGREMTVGVLAGNALPIVEIKPRQGAYDYGNKYTVGATEYLCPAPLTPEQVRRIQKAATTAFEAIGGRDYGRIDLIFSAESTPCILEVNTLPGMTETSLLPKAAAAAGLGYSDLCEKMVDLALHRLPEMIH